MITGNWRSAANAADAVGCGRSDDQAKGAALTLEAVAAMFKISTLSLRFFEWRGLVRRRRVGTKLVYSWSDCERIALIVKARKAGVPLRRLSAIVIALDTEASPRGFEAGRKQCLKAIRRLEKRKIAIQDLLAELHRIDWELWERLADKSNPPEKGAN